MKVYILLFSEDYEGDYIIGVYRSKQKAEQLAEKENKKISAFNKPYQKYVVVEKDVL